MKNSFYIIVCILLVSGCKQKNENPSKITKADSFSALPFDTVQDGSINIEVFDFKNFQPFLHKNNDSIYIVNFWATWCKPCIKELPGIEKIQQDYSHKKVKVILTSLDFPDKIKSQLIPFIKKMNFQSQVLVLDEPDANAWIPKVDTAWSGAIPATLIYNNQKRIFYNKPLTYEELKKEIEQLTITKN